MCKLLIQDTWMGLDSGMREACSWLCSVEGAGRRQRNRYNKLPRPGEAERMEGRKAKLWWVTRGGCSYAPKYSLRPVGNYTDLWESAPIRKRCVAIMSLDSTLNFYLVKENKLNSSLASFPTCTWQLTPIPRKNHSKLLSNAATCRWPAYLFECCSAVVSQDIRWVFIHSSMKSCIAVSHMTPKHRCQDGLWLTLSLLLVN